jgi:hypothetical protein
MLTATDGPAGDLASCQRRRNQQVNHRRPDEPRRWERALASSRRYAGFSATNGTCWTIDGRGSRRIDGTIRGNIGSDSPATRGWSNSHWTSAQVLEDIPSAEEWPVQVQLAPVVVALIGDRDWRGQVQRIHNQADSGRGGRLAAVRRRNRRPVPLLQSLQNPAHDGLRSAQSP